MGIAAKGMVERFDSDVIGRKLSGMITDFLEGTAKDIVKIETKQMSSILTLGQGKPKVSICIPTYNRKEYLQETLASILAQTYKNYEIVIVDDGSTDGTAEMIKTLDYPVTYHWQENAGDASARNKLIELAKGEYISFIDSDDLLMPDAIEKMVNIMESESEDAIVYGSYFRIDQEGNIYGKCKRKLYSGKITAPLFKTILVHACGSMFPKKILKGPNVFDTSLKVCSDYDLWLNLSTKYRFVALSEPTFKRRRHDDNLSVSSFENCLTELRVLEKFYFENAEKDLIPESTARKVFSKENRRVGRCAINEGLHDQACRFLSQSFRQYPNPKSLISWIRAIVAKRLAS
jgi:glycosyltransferase involved in cell wall biosynthesis